MTVRDLIEQLDAMFADPDGPDILDRPVARYDSVHGSVPITRITITTVMHVDRDGNTTTIPTLLFSCDSDNYPYIVTPTT